MDFPRLGSSPLPALALGKSRPPAAPAEPERREPVEQYRCEECGRELFDLGDGPPPTRCEDCVPETGQGSRLVDQLTTNLRQLRRKAGIEREELGRRAGMSADEIALAEREAAREPGVTRALRLAHSIGVSIDDLADRIYWNPGEIARSPGDRRPSSERLSGFFLVLPANVPIFDPAPPRDPVTSRKELAEVFGENLRSARERRHLFQKTLADAAGLSREGLSYIERGIHETTIETMLSIARALQVTPEVLLGGIAWEPGLPPCAPPRRGGAQGHKANSLDAPIKMPLERRQDRRRDRNGPRRAARNRLGHRPPPARARRGDSLPPSSDASRTRRGAAATRATPDASPKGRPGRRDGWDARLGRVGGSLRRRNSGPARCQHRPSPSCGRNHAQGAGRSNRVRSLLTAPRREGNAPAKAQPHRQAGGKPQRALRLSDRGHRLGVERRCVPNRARWRDRHSVGEAGTERSPRAEASRRLPARARRPSLNRPKRSCRFRERQPELSGLYGGSARRCLGGGHRRAVLRHRRLVRAAASGSRIRPG